MAFTPGWNPDKQSRVAREAQQQTHVHGPLPLLSSGGAPASISAAWPNPSFAIRQARAATTAQDQVQGFTAGTMPAPAAATLPPGVQAFDLAPCAAARARDYSHFQAVPLNLLGQDAVNPGEQSVDLPARAVSRLRDYTIAQGLALNLLVPVGTQSVELPPRGALRARDYSLLASFPLELIGQDAVTVGTQLSGPAPAGPRRAITLGEPGSNQTVELSAAAPVFPYGQSTELSALWPRAYARARDYSITAGFPPELIGQDAVAPGFQLTGPGPAGARRAATLTEPGTNFTLVLSAAPPIIPQGQSTELSALTPRPSARARDYSIAASFPLELIGRDQFFGIAGEPLQLDWQNPRGPLRAREYGWIQSYMPVVPMGQSTDASALTPRSATRTYAVYDPGQNLTILQPTPTVSLPPGVQSTDSLPPKAPQRAKEYGQGAGFALELRGKDQLFGAAGEVPAYDWQNPRGPQRLREYGWFQSFPLYIYQQLPPGQSSADWELAPRGPQRAKDYTHLQPLSLELYGQDVMYGRPGEVPTYDWQLPTPRAARMRDYSILQAIQYGTGIGQRDLSYIVGLPQARWALTGPIVDRWDAGVSTG